MKLQLLVAVTLSLILSGVAEAQGPTTPPPPPENFRAVVDGNSVDLLWKGPEELAFYLVSVASVPGGSPHTMFVIGYPNGIRVTDVPPGTYYLKAQTWGSGGVSLPTPEIQVRVGDQRPRLPAPTNFRFRVVNSTVTLDWDSIPGLNYEVLVSSEHGSSPNLGRYQVGSATTFTAVAPNGTYYVRVHATDGYEWSMPTEEEVVVVRPPL